MSPQIQQLLGKAIECFQGGHSKQAEEILLKILSDQSNNLPALEILGLIKAIQGNHLESAKLLKKAVKLNPQNPSTQYNLAKALSEGKDYIGALIHHEKALQLAPNNPDGWLNYGQTLANLKRYEQALTAFNKILITNPTHLEAWVNKGLTCTQLERHIEALDCFNKAIDIAPNNPKTWLDLSATLGALSRYEEALHSCDQALKLQPQYPEALLNKGAAYNELKQFDEALNCLNQALAIKEDYVDAWYNKGITLEKLDRKQEALGCYDRAIELNPNFAKAWLNRGCALNFIALYKDAIHAFDQALKLQPQYPEALANKAISLYELLQFNEAIECCNKAINIDPNYIDGYWNKSFPQLVQGNFIEGWKNYEFRWHRNHSDIYRHQNIPRLTSLLDSHGKEILVWSEQGYGDTIQFSRYIPMLIKFGAKPILEVPQALAPLMNNQFDCRVITQIESIHGPSYQIPLLSLPLLFGTELTSIPAKTPYLHISRSKVKDWGGKLPLSQETLNIGIACSGNRNLELKQGNKRPIPLHYFSGLSKQHNLFLIQKEISEVDQHDLNQLEEIHVLGDLIENFEDSAAICENMDLIISVDTSLAHLAGALNKMTFILLPYCPEWRWLTKGNRSHWYPNARLFRQPSQGDWYSVMQEVRIAVENHYMTNL